jgi:hypothetical protein
MLALALALMMPKPRLLLLAVLLLAVHRPTALPDRPCCLLLLLLLLLQPAAVLLRGVDRGQTPAAGLHALWLMHLQPVQP